MPYRLHDDVSFCRVDDGLIFLDIQNDRYFRLPIAMEQAFLAAMDGNVVRPPAELLELGLLVEGPAGSAVRPPTGASLPTHSAMEEADHPPKTGIAVALEVFWLVVWTRLQLGTGKLKGILEALAKYRNDRVVHSPIASTAFGSRHLLHASALFRRARPYVPIETRCLLDSLALVRFLARRGMHANIVFGVAGNPFAAHCWAQAGKIVLNDTVGNCHAHTPIRVI